MVLAIVFAALAADSPSAFRPSADGFGAPKIVFVGSPPRALARPTPDPEVESLREELAAVRAELAAAREAAKAAARPAPIIRPVGPEPDPVGPEPDPIRPIIRPVPSPRPAPRPTPAPPEPPEPTTTRVFVVGRNVEVDATPRPDGGWDAILDGVDVVLVPVLVQYTPFATWPAYSTSLPRRPGMSCYNKRR